MAMSSRKNYVLLVVVCVGVCAVLRVSGHGRLIEPPSRSSAWRYGFSTPKNYDDNQLYCGGFEHQKSLGGKCGVCGDPWDQKSPRNNEAGGIFAKGVIVRNYKEGDTLPVVVELTAHHKGWFEFRLCPNNDVSRAVTHACLDRHLLESAGGGTRYYLPQGSGPGKYNFNLKLPAGLTCSQCVLQWKYHTGNRWGTSTWGNGHHSCTGCGPQEEFYGCADIRVSPRFSRRVRSAGPLTCTSSDRRLGYDQWCNDNCNHNPPHCPSFCICVVKPSGPLTCTSSDRRPGYDQWCDDNCNHNPPNCPSFCICN